MSKHDHPLLRDQRANRPGGTYFIAYHTTVDPDGGEAMMVLDGFYKDRLVNQADGWRFSEHADLATWIGTPRPPRLSPPPPWYGTLNHHRATLPGE